MTSFLATGVEPQRGQYRWTVKETADGTPYLFGEDAGASVKIISNNGEDLNVGFILRPDTTLEEAHG